MIKQGLKMGWRALGVYLMAVVLCALLCLPIGADWYWAQVLLNLALLAAMGLLSFSDGGYRGEKACTMSALERRLLQEGRTPGPEVAAGKFYPAAALAAFLTCALPLLAIAGVNLAAEPYYPAAVEQEQAQEQEALLEQLEQLDQMSPEEQEQALLEAQELAQQAGPTNWFNVVARITFMAFVFLYQPFAQNPHGLNWLFLALALLPALPAPIGYLLGPRLRRKKLMDIEKGKKRKLKRLRVHQKPKTPKEPKREV